MKHVINYIILLYEENEKQKYFCKLMFAISKIFIHYISNLFAKYVQ